MAPPTLTVRTLPSNDAGTVLTLKEMRRLSRGALRDPLLLDVAAHIVRSEKGRAAYPRRIREWISQAVRFLPDPVGVELLRAPRWMLDDIRRRGFTQGDCDDVAILSAAIGLAVGCPARFKVLGFRANGPLAHIYAELWTGRGWLEMDTTRPFQLTPSQENPPRVWTVPA